MTETVECAVIGAGAVGLAVARALARAGHEVVILEAADAIGTGISARNSEVIHAGMYYPAGSLKAALCVRGNRLLRDYLPAHGVDHRFTGKLIVATDEAEEAQLQIILDKGRTNGVDGLTLISGAEATAMEPELSCRAALLSSHTGIIDAHGFMLSLLGEAEEHGAALALNSPVLRGEAGPGGLTLVTGGSEPMTLRAKRAVIAAGLAAQKIGHAIAGLAPGSVPPFHLCKGNYFLLSGRQPFSRLVYPTPVRAGLGVHYTVDLGGQGRFGPDVEWTRTEDYEVDPTRGEVFYTAIRRYWPGLADNALRPGYAGIRPKIQGPGEDAVDFLIQGEKDHGQKGLAALYGIESPGLTSSLAIAEKVAEMLS
ncbi:MAG TPA: NAD(P)/FAD-dependent oxidoreductase [Candidatus Sulfotelmatobacter sp.]|jgi:L-2-hydroxyglutarate oxidase LhgO|nr:NAD(P)/FAD-dependent oxidoreductase [Candidatus Sulfotelmatobacter sp.]